MEVARKLKTVMDMLAEFKARYPREKFIWVNAPLETAGEWPEHYGLGARVFKVPTDHVVKYTSKSGRVSQTNGWIYELNGIWALSKPSKIQIMHDAGVIFAREQFRRLDDGSDPDVCEMEGAAAILSLSGLVTVSGRKRIDLKITKSIQSREFLIENCESKLELRLGWKLVGLPQAFTLAELQAKEFVTFCVFSAPHATNSEERMLILRHHLGIWGPAFEDAQPLQIEGAPAPRQIEGMREEPVEIIDADEDPEPADAQAASPGGEVKQESIEPPKPLEEPPLPPGSQKPTAQKIDFLQAVGKVKVELLELLGAQRGAEEYYKLLLTFGVQHSNKLTDKFEQGGFYRKLEKMVKLIKENPIATEPPKLFAEALEMARAGYEKLPIKELLARIQAQTELQNYPPQDPLNILPILQSPADEMQKADLVEVAVRLMERSLTETTKGRERKAADPRGGGR
jgi:hypothetical protein